MKRERLLRLAFLFAIILLTVLGLYSRNRQRGKIIQLSKKIEEQTDSLELLSNRYDSLAEGYEAVYIKLFKTTESLRSLKNDIDSISHLRASDIRNMQRGLENIINREEYSRILEADSTDRFRLN